MHVMTATPLDDRPSRSTESARINLRTSPEAKALIERAAALMGTTVSGFMTQSACEAALRILSQHDTLTQLQSDFDAFIASCEKTPELPDSLRSFLARSR